MKIKKSLNNSMLLAVNDGKEIILFGKGIGFNSKPGTMVDLKNVEQVFIPLNTLKAQHYLSLTDTIPAVFFEITHEIVKLAQAHYNEKLNTVLLFTLAEHLHFAVERCKANVNIANKLTWEIKRYYQKEYNIGELARDMVSAKFSVNLPEDEAVHIAFHIINASFQCDETNAHKQVELVNRVAEIVRYKLNKNIDINSIHYARFITHLRYFAERVLSNNIELEETDDFYNELIRFHPRAMVVAEAIRDYIKNNYAIFIPNDELTWLGIHISKLSKYSI
ncbi:PRD domain-containing protein [Klebsiella michiganensis]|uniref:PRD domain-containing protein n=1 Tax=Klebsiella TaxID=570 RepID=UPI001EF8C77F|nr:PRD domain-containing protein [Klebsiella pneumoniae]ULJ12336.1 PRD domain-containing protein [Klebsiella pneumoniae]HBR2016398.1 PRD domain-containing protein [Klebsiella pneumoniae]HBR5095945.1 PRD domain-containing protein [Klebsiella pneumoniae]HBX5736301.1 PRD domain-containing protein [Klebsiella pneumoniae]HDY9404458.1 PRD domain-containing protein [Klebsiella pneumoniae]